MDIIILIVIAILSVIIASVSIIAGLAGGIVLIPILTIFFGMDIKSIVGAVLISITIPAIIGAIGAWRRHEINFQIGILFEVPTSIGVYFGARSTSFVSEHTLRLLFSLIAFVLSIQMLDRANRARKSLPKRQSRFWLLLRHIPPIISIKHKSDSDVELYHVSLTVLIFGGLIIGFLSGLLGMGGGWMKTPMLILAFGLSPVIATGTAIFMISITAIIGGTTHLLMGDINFKLMYSLIVGLGGGAFIGNHLKPKLKSYQISFLIGILLCIVALIMLKNALGIF